MAAHRFQVRVRYADTDAMGVVYNSVYLVWFEIGRAEWMRARGIPYREVEEKGIVLPVIEATLRFRSSARYDDLVTIESRLTEFRSRRVVFAYEIRLDGRCIADGTTVHVPVERQTGKSARLPAWLTERLEAAEPGRSE